jgi:hypothetical protein
MTFHCPTLEEITSATLALLPRGRAWQNNEGGPMPGYDPAFAPEAFEGNAFATKAKRHSYLWSYWRSYAVVCHYLTQRLCALREEFWCATVNETRDSWMTEYGLPDECDPFPDLCVKVAAVGGTRCEYYAAVAARMGWSIECLDEVAGCGARAKCSRAGKGRAGSRPRNATMRIVVHLDQSPAYVEPDVMPSRAGRMRAGRRMSCTGPDLSPLRCIMSRIVHAEILVTYEGTQ